MEPRPRSDELSAGADDDDAGRPGRPHLWWAAAVVVGLVAVVLVQPDLSLHGRPPASPVPTAVPSGAARDGTPPSIVTWDARGDLAADRGFLQAAVTRVRQERPEVARVFFAGRLPHGGRLVLAGTDVYRGVVATAVHALVIAPHEAVQDASVTELVALTDPQQLLAWAGRGPDGHVATVVLSRPGPVRFDLSPSVQFADDGAPRRIWTSVYTEDGVVVSDLGTEVDPVVTVRAIGPGVSPVAEVVRVAAGSGETARRVLSIRGARAPSYGGPDPELLARGLRQAAGTLADLSVARLRVLWSGAPWRQRRLALVLVTRADGVRLQAVVGQQGSSEFPVGVRALPERAPDELPWLLEPFSPADPTFLLCPTGAGTLVYGRPGRADRRLTVPRSGAVALIEPAPVPPTTSGARVTLLDPRGHQLLTTVLPGRLADPLALD